MLSSFVLLVHVPSLFANPTPERAPTVQVQGTALSVAVVLAGFAWILSSVIRARELASMSSSATPGR